MRHTQRGKPQPTENRGCTRIRADRNALLPSNVGKEITSLSASIRVYPRFIAFATSKILRLPQRFESVVAQRRARLRSGFTLMEVLLAMAIAAIVLAAITMAIDFHLRVVDRGRRDVEEAQLARALLRRIADDLRSAVAYEPLDVEGLLTGASGASATAAAGDALGAGAGDDSGAAAGGSNNDSDDANGDDSSSTGQNGQSGQPGTSDSGTESQTDDLAQSVVMSTTPGLYGNRYELQVDVSRLPRLEQYEMLMEASVDGPPPDLVSDVKTVAYYVLDGQTGEGAGLVRRELDRAATAWANTNGGLMELERYQQMLAPEVISLEFQYFDGLDWFEEWDSAIHQGLPLAVEIALALAPAGTLETLQAPIDLSMPSELQEYRVYRLLVHLPAARSAEDAAAAASTSELPPEPTEALP